MPSLLDPDDDQSGPGTGLGALYQAVTDALERGNAPATGGLLWSPGNPVGTERLREQSLSMPRGPFDPINPGTPTSPGASRPLTVGEYQGVRQAGEDLFSQLGAVDTGGGAGGPAPRLFARPRARSPDLPPPPPAPAGRLGGNADTQLAALGLPAYGDIVPSPSTGPLSEARLRAGAPQGSVFDLSNTWQVPDVAQTPLQRIDPNAGARKGLPAHIQGVIDDPAMAAKLRSVAEAGVDAGGAYWYNAEPLRQSFVNELGADEGNAQFNRYMSIVGATSAGSDVGQNVRTASYYLTRERAGDPVNDATRIESPYGHKMQQAHVSGYLGLGDEGGGTLNPETQPKRSSFVQNLQGNQQPVTVDKHNLRLIGMLSQDPGFLNTKTTADVNYPELGIAKGDSRNWRDEVTSGNISMDQALDHPHMWQDVPNPNHYGALENWQSGIAQDMGLTPAQFQAALWVGGGRVTGLRSLPTSFMGTVENRLQRTAAARGGTPGDALTAFIRGKAPLPTPLAAAGAGAGGLLGPMGDDKP
jgi:hypothetical protein